MFFITWLVYGIIACAIIAIIASFEKGPGIIDTIIEVVQQSPVPVWIMTLIYATMFMLCIVFWPVSIGYVFYAKGKIFVEIVREEYKKEKNK